MTYDVWKWGKMTPKGLDQVTSHKWERVDFASAGKSTDWIWWKFHLPVTTQLWRLFQMIWGENSFTFSFRLWRVSVTDVNEKLESRCLWTESFQWSMLHLCVFLLALTGTRTKIEVLQVTGKWENGVMNKSAHGDAQLNGKRERERENALERQGSYRESDWVSVYQWMPVKMRACLTFEGFSRHWAKLTEDLWVFCYMYEKRITNSAFLSRVIL